MPEIRHFGNFDYSKLFSGCYVDWLNSFHICLWLNAYLDNNKRWVTSFIVDYMILIMPLFGNHYGLKGRSQTHINSTIHQCTKIYLQGLGLTINIQTHIKDCIRMSQTVWYKTKPDYLPPPPAFHPVHTTSDQGQNILASITHYNKAQISSKPLHILRQNHHRQTQPRLFLTLQFFHLRHFVAFFNSRFLSYHKAVKSQWLPTFTLTAEECIWTLWNVTHFSQHSVNGFVQLWVKILVWPIFILWPLFSCCYLW